MKIIRQLRESKNISQEALAASLAITRESVSRYESGTRMPRPGVLIRIADFFGVSVDYLLRNQDGTCQ